MRRQNAIRMVLCLKSWPPAGSTPVAQVTFTPGTPRLLRQITMTSGRFAADPVLATYRAPVQLLEGDGERPSRRDDNSLVKVQNVRGDSSAAGSTVVSTGGVPATLQGGVRAAIMPDPNGLFLVLLQAQPPRPAAVQSR
jgi:hypothetical protein